MQEKFVFKKFNKTGQIKSISKYEMLYIPKSIPAKRVYLNSFIEFAIDVSDFNGSQLYCGRNGSQFNNKQNRLGSSHLINSREYVIHGVSRFIITSVVCLWWITFIGFAHCGDIGNSVFHANESNANQRVQFPFSVSQTSIQVPISSKKYSDGTTRSSYTSNIYAMQTAVHRKRIHQTLSLVFVLNVLKNDKRSEQNIVDHPVDSNCSCEQHQRQLFGISIITHSKKTNLNASSSLDLFKLTGNSWKHKISTLNSLGHVSSRLPDAIQKSLHRNVKKKLKQFVTKRYHFSAKTKDNLSIFTSITKKLKTETRTIESKATLNDKAGPVLKHFIHVFTAIQPNGNIELTKRTHKTLYRLTKPHLATLQNDSNVSIFNLNGFVFEQHTPRKIHRKYKRSIDRQKKQKKRRDTTQTQFDDQFLNSKLKNYYFLYQIDNIRTYNNHFDLLNKPHNYNETKIKINDQIIRFFHNQNDKALIGTIKSDFLKYNPEKLKLSNHSNKIKHILLAKIASARFKCSDGKNSSVNVYILSRSLPIASSLLNVIDQKRNNKLKSVLVDSEDINSQIKWDYEESFEKKQNEKHCLKNYPKIAGLLSNLSLDKISHPTTMQFNYSDQSVRPSDVLKKKLQVIIGKHASDNNNYIASLYAHSVQRVPIAFSKSLKSRNITNNHLNNEPTRAARNNSNYNYSPISTFEHYIRIISSRNLNNRKNYYTNQANDNKSKSFNFQHLKQKLKRVKKQKQIIKLFTKNHSFISNDINGNTPIDNIDNGLLNKTNIVKKIGLNMALNERNCATKIMNLKANQNQAQRFYVEKIGQNETVRGRVLTTVKRQRPINQKAEMIEITKSVNVNRKDQIIVTQHQKNSEKTRTSNALNSYLIRLESIKHQILMKLGLKQKPNITNTLPKHMIMETLYRADDANLLQSRGKSNTSFNITF